MATLGPPIRYRLLMHLNVIHALTFFDDIWLWLKTLNWTTFLPTLTATIVGAVSALSTAFAIAKRNDRVRKRENMTTRIQDVLEALYEWRHIMLPSKTRRATMRSVHGDSWYAAYKDQIRDRTATMIVRFAILRLEANKVDRTVIESIQGAIARISKLDEPSARAEAVSPLSTEIEEWWTGGRSHEKAIEKFKAMPAEASEESSE